MYYSSFHKAKLRDAGKKAGGSPPTVEDASISVLGAKGFRSGGQQGTIKGCIPPFKQEKALGLNFVEFGMQWLVLEVGASGSNLGPGICG